MKLKPEERKAIFAGDNRALRRKEQPEVREGQTLVLAWSRGGKQFVERNEEARKKAAAAGAKLTIDIPRKPTLWIEMAEPRLRDGEWLIEFKINDHREPMRLLAPPPSPKREPGLKTRWRPPEQVPKRGKEREYFTAETERGYGAGGRSAVDEREGVDDATLAEYARRIEEENELRQSSRKTTGHLMAEEMRLARMRKKQLSKPEAESAVIRRIQRAKRRLERAA